MIIILLFHLLLLHFTEGSSSHTLSDNVPRSSLIRLPCFVKKIHMVLRGSFQVMSPLRGLNPQREFLSFRATPEVNFSALSPFHIAHPSRCPSPNKSAPRAIIRARVSAKGARCREVASLHVSIELGCDCSKLFLFYFFKNKSLY